MFEQLGLYVLPLVGSTLLAIALFNLFGDLRKTESKRITERLKSRDGFSAADRNERAARESLLRQQKTPVSGVGGSIARLKIATALQRIMDQANIPWSATVLLVNLVGLSAVAFIVGYSDSIAEMEKVYDRHAGNTGLEVSPAGWKLTR